MAEPLKLKNCVSLPVSDKSEISPICSGTCHKAKEALTNAAQSGVMFKGMHLEPGLVRYDDLVNPFTNATGMTLFLDRPGIEAIRNTFVGKPVYNEMHPVAPVKPDDIPTGVAVGAVAANASNAAGEEEVSFLAWEKKAVENCRSGKYALSCSYFPTVDGVPGVHNSMAYDSKVVGGEYEHLAIVKNPRYEKSKIQAVQNSKETPMADKKEGALAKIAKMVKKLAGGVDNAFDAPMATEVEMEGGAKVSLEDLLTAHTALLNSKAAAAEVEKNKITDDSIVHVENGQPVTVGQLKADYAEFKKSALPTLKNEEKKDEEKKEEKKGDEKKEDKKDDEKKEAEKVKNAAAEQTRLDNEAKEKVAKEEAFLALKNAGLNRPEEKTQAPAADGLMQADRLKAGNSI